MTYNFHLAVKYLLHRKADALTGYQLKKTPEIPEDVRVSYFCRVNPNKPYAGPETGPFPLDNGREYHVIEGVGESQQLDDALFRYYVGEALLMECLDGKTSLRGKVAMTLLVVHSPMKLLQSGDYIFEQLSPWKYRASPGPDVMMDVILLRELPQQAGVAENLLKLLEPDAQRRFALWCDILNSKPPESVTSLMVDLDLETYSRAEDACAQG